MSETRPSSARAKGGGDMLADVRENHDGKTPHAAQSFAGRSIPFS